MARGTTSTVAEHESEAHQGHGAPPPRRPLRRELRRHGPQRQARQGPDVRAPLDDARGPPLRRDHLGAPDGRHRQRERQDGLRAEGRRGPELLVASSPPTSSSASTSAATSAPRSARRSVKQLIDRVVNTIAAWAETQHYFATDEDLATFKAELTHLLVHQKMAFNSPVWFNVGRRREAAVLRVLHQLGRRTRWARSWTSPRPRPCSSSSARARASTSPPSAAPRRRWPAAASASGPGLLHEGLRRLRRRRQVGRQDPPRGQDGHPRRRPPGRPRVHRLEGQRGEEGLGADRSRATTPPSRARPTARSSSRTPTTPSA